MKLYSLLLLVAAVVAPTAAHHPDCETALKTCKQYHPDEADTCACVDCGDESGEYCWTYGRRNLRGEN